MIRPSQRAVRTDCRTNEMFTIEARGVRYLDAVEHDS